MSNEDNIHVINQDSPDLVSYERKRTLVRGFGNFMYLFGAPVLILLTGVLLISAVFYM